LSAKARLTSAERSSGISPKNIAPEIENTRSMALDHLVVKDSLDHKLLASPLFSLGYKRLSPIATLMSFA
jgi:hypothetical protein